MISFVDWDTVLNKDILCCLQLCVAILDLAFENVELSQLLLSLAFALYSRSLTLLSLELLEHLFAYLLPFLEAGFLPLG